MFRFPDIVTVVSAERPGDVLDAIDRSQINTGMTQTTLFGFSMDVNLTEINLTRRMMNQKGEERPVPSNYDEAYASLRFISGSNSGANNRYFDLKDLKKIAENLRLKVTGDKKSQADIIIQAILKRHGRDD